MVDQKAALGDSRLIDLSCRSRATLSPLSPGTLLASHKIGGS